MDWLNKLTGKKLYCRITLKVDHGKGGFTCETNEVNELMWYEEEDDFDFTYIWMRPREYRALPEFEGF